MEQEHGKATRRVRADSIRNRERLLEAATEIFSAGGTQASLEAVARKAGVGIGTLYRHFPTREALFEAVYRHEVDLLGELAEQLEKQVYVEANMPRPPSVVWQHVKPLADHIFERDVSMEEALCLSR